VGFVGGEGEMENGRDRQRYGRRYGEGSFAGEALWILMALALQRFCLRERIGTVSRTGFNHQAHAQDKEDTCVRG
jgi:hypothetical protein